MARPKDQRKKKTFLKKNETKIKNAVGVDESDGRGYTASLGRWTVAVACPILLVGKTVQQLINLASLKGEPGGLPMPSSELGGHQHVTCCSVVPSKPPVPLGPET